MDDEEASSLRKRIGEKQKPISTVATANWIAHHHDILTACSRPFLYDHVSYTVVYERTRFEGSGTVVAVWKKRNREPIFLV
jgi:hypothetical protein